MPYMAAGASKLFAADDGGIYDISVVADPDTPLSPASGIGTVGDGDFSHVQFATAGGEFLICVNGVDLHKTFDGTNWTENSPAITGTTSDNFNHVFSFKNRLFFVKKQSQTFCYLPVDSIGGAVSSFPLGGVFKKGGTLLTGGTWSVDSGSGLDDLCVFISSEGEVAVYSGSNPGDATDWTLQGVYQIGRPMGKKAMFKAGGDLVVATNDALTPLSAAYNKDRQALLQVAASYPIEELWSEQTALRNSFGWSCETFPARQMVFIGTPTYSGLDAQVLVANARTGAWSVFTGFDVRSMAAYANQFFFGTSGGIVYEAETGAEDDGDNYICRAAGLFTDLGAPALQKECHLARGIFQSDFTSINPLFSISTGGFVTWDAAPSASADPAGSALWGSGTWGSSTWGGTATRNKHIDWYTVNGVGDLISWQVQVTLGNAIDPDIELAAVDLVYEVGEVIG
jgi:hypothetical protein